MITKMLKFLCLVSAIAHVSSQTSPKHKDYQAKIELNIKGANLTWTHKSEAGINDPDKTRFYYFDQENVTITCTSIIYYNVQSSKNFLLRLSSPDKSDDLLEYCSQGIHNKSILPHTLIYSNLLTSAMLEFDYSCSLIVGDSPCSQNKHTQELKILRVVEMKLAKLRIYINGKDVTQEKENEVIYKYVKENITIKATCSHGEDVYKKRNFTLPVPAIWNITEGLSRKLEQYGVRNNGQNSLKITLFAGLHGTYIDCVENLGNRVPLAATYRPSKIRLKFIYDSGTANPDCDPVDAKEAEEACGGFRDICITVDGKTAQDGQSFSYTDLKKIHLGCHLNLRHAYQNDLRLHWKQNGVNVDDYVKCRKLPKTISRLADNTTVFTCEAVHEKNPELDSYKTNITIYNYKPQLTESTTTKEITTTEESSTDTKGTESKSFLETHWILLAAASVVIFIVIVALIITCLVFNSRKRQREDETRLNPKGSRNDLDEIPTGHRPNVNSTPRPQPKLQELYTDLGSDGATEVYCDPYQAMYTKPIPKSVRKPAVPTPRNQKDSSKPHKELSNYNNTESHAATMYNNLKAQNTGTMFHNIDKRNKNTEQVHFYDNAAAGYSNTTNTKYNDVYSEPGLYDVPS